MLRGKIQNVETDSKFESKHLKISPQNDTVEMKV
jgi:hypothetical protein